MAMLAFALSLVVSQWSSAALNAAVATGADAETWLPTLRSEEAVHGRLPGPTRAKLEALASRQLLEAVGRGRTARARSLASLGLESFGREGAFGSAVVTAREEAWQRARGSPVRELPIGEAIGWWELLVVVAEPGSALQQKARQHLAELQKD